MSGIGGNRREGNDFAKEIGLFEGRVVAISPTAEQFKEVLGRTLEEDSKEADYLGEREGNTLLRIDVWLEVVKNPGKFKKVSFFLEDKERVNKDGTKNQYINAIGSCSWAESEEGLPDWFVKREYRQAYVGEEELYNFMRTWLSELDYRAAETTLKLDWKKLMKGNVKDLKEQVGGEWAGNVGALATVVTKEVEGEVKEYSNIYNKAFLPAYALKNFRLIDYDNEELQGELQAKASKDLKTHEKFVVSVIGEYGAKGFFKLKELQEYKPEENLAAQEGSKGGSPDPGDGPGY